MQCGFGGATCADCTAQLSCSGGACVGGNGNGCGSPIDITGFGDISFPIDTCSYPDNVTVSGCSVPGTPEAILSSLQGGTTHLDVPSGWIVAYLDPSGSCNSVPGACGGMYGASGSTGNPRWYFAVERATGGCGRVTVHIMAN